MNLNVLGLVSIDVLEFDEYASYLGGGALSTAWVASLWEVHSTLYSISYEKVYNKVFDRNSAWNNKFFSHITLSESKPMTKFEISKYDEEYRYKIFNLSLSQNELNCFLRKTTDMKYVKLPAANFLDVEARLTTASLNPQGKFNLIDFTEKIHTDGFIFLNYSELLASSKLNLSSSLRYIENLQQSFVITLGRDGAICYYSNEATWYFCPSIQLVQVASTLGCGDAFAGGFLASYAKHYDLSDCMFYGTISAYLVTHSAGNMVEFWLKRTSEENVFIDLKRQIKQFSSAKDIVNFLRSEDSKTISLSMLPDLSRDFNWKLSDISYM